MWVAEENGVRAVVKDFSSNGFLYRHVVGRFLIWREAKAYRRLKGLEGVPSFIRVIDGLALVMQEIPGESVDRLDNKGKLPADFFDKLRGLVKSFHMRGLAHCDLKRAPNILLGHDGKPYVVDWAASISKREFGFFPLNLIYQRFSLDDLNAIVKLQLKHAPETVPPKERRRYEQRGSVERLIRAMRNSLRELLKKVA